MGLLCLWFVFFLLLEKWYWGRGAGSTSRPPQGSPQIPIPQQRPPSPQGDAEPTTRLCPAAPHHHMSPAVATGTFLIVTPVLAVLGSQRKGWGGQEMSFSPC